MTYWRKGILLSGLAGGIWFLVSACNIQGNSWSIDSTFHPGFSQVTVTSVSPPASVAAGGGTLVITGANFFPGMAVRVGASPCTPVVVVSSTTVSCVVPPDANIETVNVAVTAAGGSLATLTSAFTYVGTPVLWLSASSGITSSGGVVSSWGDQSGTGNNATQVVSANQPTWVPGSSQFNNKPVVNFDGATSFMNLSNLSDFQNVPGATWVMAASTTSLVCGNQHILEYTTAAVGSTRFGAGICSGGTDVGTPAGAGSINLAGRRLDGDGLDMISGGASLTANTAFSASGVINYTGASATLRVNRSVASTSSVFQAAGSTSNTASAAAYIGGHAATFFFSGSMAEIFAYNVALTTAQVQVIENYLQSLYALP